jgi:hypothetical protein
LTGGPKGEVSRLLIEAIGKVRNSASLVLDGAVARPRLARAVPRDR